MSINLNVTGNTQPLEAAVNAAINRIRKTPIKITVDDKGATQPLGNMKRGADEFSKSMEAANSRIIAFGASMAIINGVADGFKALVKNVVEVEKALADINVVMNLSTANLEKFSNGLFKTAKETGAAFNVAAEAATEYARQGLTMEESLKRTRDALILTRLTGMDSANAVKALTAAMNTYGDQIKDTTELVSKFAAVDVKFAVSAEDFADAISRTGQAAKSAGVDIDELVGLVTAAQQQTARGGKVIGNSFKTIFTRIGRSDTLNQLENLGIAVRDLEGNTLGAKRILTDLANTFDKLTASQQNQIAQTVGGVFQINVLKAVLSDAAKQNGILASATQISSGATTEAIDKNDQLRQTMSAMATETGLALKELSAQIGEIMLAPGMEKVLNVFKGLAEGANEMLGGGESTGSDFAQGFLKGLGNIITGPGLVVISAVFIKLFAKALVYANQSLRSLIGVTSEAHKQKAIQTSLVTLFGQNAAISKEMLRTDISRTEKERIILGLLKAQVIEANMLNSVSKSVAGGLYTRGYNANLAPRKGRSGGHIPNFADPERAQAARGGYAAGTIRSMNMPGEGSVIYNSAEKVKNFKGMSQPAIMPPHSSKAGKNYQQAFGDVHGFDPYAAGGYIPNYAKLSFTSQLKSGLSGKDKDVFYVAKKLSEGKKYKDINTKSFGQRKELDDYIESNPGKFSGISSLDVLTKRYQKKTQLNEFIRKQQSNKNIINPVGSSYALLVAGKGADEPARRYVVNAAEKDGVMGIKPSSMKNFKPNQKGKMSRIVDVPVYRMGGKDKSSLKVDAAKVISNKLKHYAVPAGVESAKNFIPQKLIPKDLESKLKAGIDKNTVSTLAGLVFEKIIASVMSAGNWAKYNNQNTTEPIDLPSDPALRELFGVPAAVKASLGFEAKLNSNERNVQSAAQKFYKKMMPAAADGFIPNFANPLSDAIGREKAAGVPVSQIRVGSHPALMGKSNPIGLGVTNTHDEPNGLRDVIGAANGYVPNYVAPTLSKGDMGITMGRTQQQLADQYNKELKARIDRLKKGTYSEKQFGESIRKLSSRYGISSAGQAKVDKEVRSLSGPISKAKRSIGRMGSSLSSMNSRFGKTGAGKAIGSSGGQMALMMGAPMAASFLEDSIGGDNGKRASAALEGVGSGAAMGMMFGPLGTALGAAAGGLYGLYSASTELRKAQEEQARQSREASIESGKQLGASLAKGFSSPGQISFASSLNKGEYLGGGITMPGRSDLKIEDPRALLPVGGKGSFGISSKGASGEIYKQLAGLVDSSETGSVIKDSLDSLFSFTKTKKNPEGMINSSHLTRDLAKSFKGTSLEGQEDEILKMAKSNAEKSGSRLDRSSFQKAMTDQSVAKMGTEARKEMLFKSLHNIKTQSPGEKIKLGEKEFSPDDLIKEVGNDPEKIKAAYRSMLENFDKNTDARKKEADAVIVQLDIQKAQIAAQKAAAMNQLKIKDRYSELSDNLKFQVTLMGSLMTDKQKAENKYLQAINKSSEAYEKSAASADAQLKKGLLDQVKNNSDVQGLMKKSLGLKGGKSFQDITDSVSSLTGEDLTKKLKEIAADSGTGDSMRKAINELLTLEVEKRQNILEIAKKTKTNSTDQATREQKINNILAGRSQIIKDLKRKNSMSSEDLRSSQKIRGFTEKVAAAKRLNAVGPGYQTNRERENFTMSEKGFGLESQITTLGENRDKTLAELGANKLGYEMDDQRLDQLTTIKDEDFISKGEFRELEALVASTEERKKKLEEIEQKIKNINSETDSEISKAETLLKKEKERLEIKRKHETGPGAFGRGFRDTAEEMGDSIETFNHELGNTVAVNFRDGIAEAMKVGLNGADDLGDALMSVASNFLGAIQNAFLQNAANAIVSKIPMPSGNYTGGAIRNYSRGGGVPAMVSDGEYVMNSKAVNKYGGSFMHGLNAGGNIPGFSEGGAAPGSALAANFGGGRGVASGRSYQSKAMSGFFYSQSGNLGLKDDEQALVDVLAEEERKRQEAAAKKAKKRALIKQLVGTAASFAVSYGLSGGFSGGGAKQGMGRETLLKKPASSFENLDSFSSNFTSPSRGALNEGIKNGNASSLFDYYNGGPIRKYASGGHIAGKSGIDQIPAMLSEGEYVIRSSSARQIGKPTLDRINAGKFNDGGSVSPINSSSESAASGGSTNNINISINMENGKAKNGSSSSSSSGGNSSEASDGQQDMVKLGEKVKQQVLTVIVEEKRPGGLLHEQS